jgi:hypothetical protein
MTHEVNRNLQLNSGIPVICIRPRLGAVRLGNRGTDIPVRGGAHGLENPCPLAHCLRRPPSRRVFALRRSTRTHTRKSVNEGGVNGYGNVYDRHDPRCANQGRCAGGRRPGVAVRRPWQGGGATPYHVFAFLSHIRICDSGAPEGKCGAVKWRWCDFHCARGQTSRFVDRMDVVDRVDSLCQA